MRLLLCLLYLLKQHIIFDVFSPHIYTYAQHVLFHRLHHSGDHCLGEANQKYRQHFLRVPQVGLCSNIVCSINTFSLFPCGFINDFFLVDFVTRNTHIETKRKLLTSKCKPHTRFMFFSVPLFFFSDAIRHHRRHLLNPQPLNQSMDYFDHF